MDLTEVEDTKKRWQEYTEEPYKKYLNDPDNHDGMFTPLEPDILECKVKWALGSIPTKLVEVQKFQLSYFKSCELNMPANWENSAVVPGLEKVSFHSNAKECSNYHTIALISHTSILMPIILQARFQQYVNWKLPDAQAGFRKGRRTRDQIANIHWNTK